MLEIFEDDDLLIGMYLKTKLNINGFTYLLGRTGLGT